MKAKNKLRILLVDDEEFIRLTINETLSANCHEVEEADCVPAAITLLENQDFDLVITDRSMPGGPKGEVLIQWLRENRPATEIIWLTAEVNDPEVAEIIMQYKLEYLLPKPISLAAVAAMVYQISTLEPKPVA